MCARVFRRLQASEVVLVLSNPLDVPVTMTLLAGVQVLGSAVHAGLPRTSGT